MPHGKKVLFPTITLTIAASLSMIVLCICVVIVKPSHTSPSHGADLWGRCTYPSYYYDPNNDYEYTRVYYEDDPIRTVAMSFASIAFSVGTVSMIALWPITCKPYKMIMIRIIGCTVLLAFVCQLLILLMFGTEYCEVFGCTLGWGGALSVVAAALWLIGAVLVWLIPKPINMNESSTAEQRRDDTGMTGSRTSHQAARGTVEITETIKLDGTKVTETVTTGPDGTKTIQKTIETPVDNAGIQQPQNFIAYP